MTSYVIFPYIHTLGKTDSIIIHFFEANKNQFFTGFDIFMISRSRNLPLSDAFYRNEKSIRVVKREWFKVKRVSWIYYKFPSSLKQQCWPTTRFNWKECFFTAKCLTPLTICLQMVWTSYKLIKIEIIPNPRIFPDI